MRWYISTAIAFLFFLGSFSCKKTETVTVTIRDTIRTTDTVVIKSIRVDKYGGRGTLDCIGGCGVVIDTNASVEVSYYPNDSTLFRLITASDINLPRWDTFWFSIVAQKFSVYDDEVYSYYQRGSDSLTFAGDERPSHGLGTLTFAFSGRKL